VVVDPGGRFAHPQRLGGPWGRWANPLSQPPPPGVAALLGGKRC